MTRPVLHFLPSLRALELELECDTSLSSVPLFFTPTLTRLSFTINCRQDEDLIQYAIREIRRLSRLNHLRLFGGFQRVQRGVIALDTIQCLEHLESVHINLSQPMFASVFAALSCHPKLKHVRLSYRGRRMHQISKAERNELPQLDSSNHVNATLETIVLNNCASFQLRDAFNSHQFEIIREFKATDMSIRTSGEARQFLSNLVAACPLLEIFHVSFKFSNTTNPLPFALKYHTVAPIVLHAGLRDLRISYNYPLILTRSDMQNICRALGPTIEILLLNPSPTQRDKIRPFSKLFGLYPIARKCRRLRQLGIFLESSFPSPFPAPSVTPKFSGTMEDIDFGASAITKRAPVIELLVSMDCPRVKVSPGMPADLHASWTAIAEGVELMRNSVGEVDQLRHIDEELQLKLREASVESNVEEEVVLRMLKAVPVEESLAAFNTQ